MIYKKVKIRGRDRATKTSLKLAYEEGGSAGRETRSMSPIRKDQRNPISDVIHGMG